MENEIVIHTEDSGFAKGVNEVFPLNKAIRIINSYDKEDREHWRKVILTTLIHNTTRTRREALEVVKEIEEAVRRLK